MRVVVTGASGFIGRHVVQALAPRHAVVATGRDAERLAPLRACGARVAVADLATDGLDELVRESDAVVHCAARASPWGSRDSFVLNNVVATERLLEAALRAGVRRFVHLSSPSIYFRFLDGTGISEDLAPPRRWPTAYAESKWLSEGRVFDARFAALEPIALRPRAVFGEGDRAIVPRLLAAARRGVFPLIRDGAALIDVTYVANVVSAVERALEARAEHAGRAYNITNGQPVTVRALLERLFGALDVRVRFVPLPRSVALLLARAAEAGARLRPGAPEPRLTRYGVALLAYDQTLDISAARARLGYVPAVSLDEGLDRALAWLQAHGAH